MTKKQKLNAVRRARRHLKHTAGFDPEGGHYKAVLDALDTLEAAYVVKVPALGPVWKGGKSVLLHDLTHPTGGIPLYPAFDDAYVPGRKVIAPERMVVTKQSSSRPGDAFYATGESGLKYWFGHLVKAPATGKKFAKGEVIGVVLDHSVGGGPHVHVGINVEAILGAGKQLLHHTNYTHGAPLVGVQLRKALEGR